MSDPETTTVPTTPVKPPATYVPPTAEPTRIESELQYSSRLLIRATDTVLADDKDK